MQKKIAETAGGLLLKSTTGDQLGRTARWVLSCCRRTNIEVPLHFQDPRSTGLGEALALPPQHTVWCEVEDLGWRGWTSPSTRRHRPTRSHLNCGIVRGVFLGVVYGTVVVAGREGVCDAE